MFNKPIQKRLESFVKKYFKRHPEVKLVAVAGSVGKTSTKNAIATVLSEKFRVRADEGNHNTLLSVSLAILGIDYPVDVRNIGEWLAVFRAAKLRISEPTDVDVIVQEIGTDRIGEIPQFGKYLSPDIGVVTAVSAEHMEFFQNIDNVAREELALANFSKLALINRDDIDGKYADLMTNGNIDTYGTSATAEYHFMDDDLTVSNGYDGKLYAPELATPIQTKLKLLGDHTLRPAVAAAAVAIKLGMSADEIAAGMAKIRTTPGRMNVLRGLKDSIIIDDTYNSSPLAAVCALQALYALTVPQRIAVLGSMAELGDSSIDEHKVIGQICDPARLAWVITVGDDANEYIATVARSKGCQVKTCKNALEAGSFAHSVMETGSAILFKGSQSVFLEEAVKVVLHSSDENEQLVRQELQWTEIKNNYFSQ